jgi:hypothetical protein
MDRPLPSASTVADILRILVEDTLPYLELSLKIRLRDARGEVNVHLHTGILINVQIGAAEAHVVVPGVDDFEAWLDI